MRPALTCLALTTLAGCVTGLRGGPRVGVYDTGAVLTETAVTGSIGFGSRHADGDAEVSDGLLTAHTLRVGGDARRGGASLSYQLGLEWFRVPETSGRVGWRAGADVGFGGRDVDLRHADMLAELRAGALLRLADRRSLPGQLWVLGVEATLGGAIDLARTAPQSAITGGVVVTVGFMNVNRFHL